jgi:hypothetical protein
MREMKGAMSENVTVIEKPDGTEAPSCRHHWLIESPAGSTSVGVCKNCGARKEFYNSTPETVWDSDTTVDLSNRWGRSKEVDPEGSLSMASAGASGETVLA